MNNLNTITQDWTHADQFLNDKIDKNNNSIKHDFDGLTSDVNTRFTSVENEVKMLNGTADGQFIYDTEAKMTKVVPDVVNKGIVSMVGGKTQKMVQMADISGNTTTVSGVTITPDGYGGLTISSSGAVSSVVRQFNTVNVEPEEKWYFSGGNSKISVGFDGYVNWIPAYPAATDVPKIVTSKTSYAPHAQIVINSDTALTATKIYPKIINLTAMFGAGKEPTVQECMAMFGDMDYIPYGSYLWNAPVEKIVLTGRNLFNKTLVQDSYAKATQLPNGISLTGSYYALFYFDCKPNTNYTMSYTADGDNQVGIYDETISDAGKIALWSGLTGGTFNSGSNKRIVVLLYASRGSNTKTSNYYNICLVEGATAPTAYTPYTKTTLSLERIVDNLPDYGASAGDVYNYVDFEEMVYHHKVIEVNPSKLNWKKYSDNLFYSSDNIFKKYDENAKIGLISNKYTTKDITIWMSTYNKESECICLQPSTTNQLWICDLKQTDLTAFVNSLTDVKLYAELPQEELIPLTDLILPFKCEPGGTVTFENEHNLDVPNSIIYEKEMK